MESDNSMVFYNVRTSFPLPLAATVTGSIFLVDTLSSLQFAVASLYVTAVLIAAHDVRRQGVVITRAGCALLTVLSYVLMHGFGVDGIASLRSAVSLVSFLTTTGLALRNLAASSARWLQ
jgi:hypothetical protein